MTQEFIKYHIYLPSLFAFYLLLTKFITCTSNLDCEIMTQVFSFEFRDNEISMAFYHWLTDLSLITTEVLSVFCYSIEKLK